MKKYVILSLSFLAVFILLIFQSSFCWASSDVVVTLSNSKEITLQDSSEYASYPYCYYLMFNNNNEPKIILAQSPLYYYRASGDLYSLVTFTSNEDYVVYTMSYSTDDFATFSYFKQAGSAFTSSTGISSVSESNSEPAFYSDNTLTESDNNYSYYVTYNSTIIPVAGMKVIVDNLAFSLGLDTLFEQVNNVIPIIVIAVLFVFGFIIIRRLMKGFSKGKLKV